MINALTGSRIILASRLYDMHDKLCELCNFACLTHDDVTDLESALSSIDKVVNRVMTDKRKK